VLLSECSFAKCRYAECCGAFKIRVDCNKPSDRNKTFMAAFFDLTVLGTQMPGEERKKKESET
jgi:hypothetical protein